MVYSFSPNEEGRLICSSKRPRPKKGEVFQMAKCRNTIPNLPIQAADVSKIVASLHKIQVNTEKLYKGTPCWEWQGYLNSTSGYPSLRLLGEYYAHRIYYRYFIGPIPEGYHVDHCCHNRICCSPLHLEAITPQENRKRRNDAKTHCVQGHELTGDNVYYLAARFSRGCRQCQRGRNSSFNSRNPGYYET